MSFKRTIPYFITGTAMMFMGANTLSSNDKTSNFDRSIDTINYTIKPVSIPSIEADSMTLAEIPNKNDTIAITAMAQRYDVVYTRANGDKFRRSGGTRAWRNMNPGNIRYSDFARRAGAIGHAGGFAVFPDEATGMNAISELLRSDKYRNLTISQAIFKYAPPHENNTASYKASLRRKTGLSINKKIFELNDEQMTRVVNAIREVEGWRAGKQILMEAKKEPADSLKFYAATQKRLINQKKQKTI